MTANAHTRNPCHDNLKIAALSACEGEILVREILVRKILVRKSMACSGSEQPDMLGPCVLAPVAMLSLIDLRSRLRLGHGGQRLANRHDCQRDASKNRAATMDACHGHGLSPRDTMAIADNP